MFWLSTVLLIGSAFEHFIIKIDKCIRKQNKKTHHFRVKHCIHILRYKTRWPLSRSRLMWKDVVLLAWRYTLQWRHNGRDSVSNQQLLDCLFNILFRHRSKKTSKLRVTGLCEGKSPGTGEFPAQKASNAENVSTWWRHHELPMYRVSVRLHRHVLPAISKWVSYLSAPYDKNVQNSLRLWGHRNFRGICT